MSNPWQIPGRKYVLEFETVATFISAIAYGLVVSLHVLCCHALFKGQRKYSTRRKWFLLSYSTIMFSLSTFAIVEDMKTVIVGIFGVPPDPTGILAEGYYFSESTVTVLPITIWGADFFMMWRCAVLYQGTSKVIRGILYSGLILLGLGSLVSGLIFVIGITSPIELLLALISVSFAVNSILSILITLRIRDHQQSIRQTLGTAHGSLYTRITAMCVESCGLITACTLVALILTDGQFGGSEIPIELLPHICVISPLLIVYRVANGMEVGTTVNVSEVVDGGINRMEADIRFAPGASSQSSQGV